MPGETGTAKLAPPIWLGERGSAILKSKRTCGPVCARPYVGRAHGGGHQLDELVAQGDANRRGPAHLGVVEGLVVLAEVETKSTV